MSKLADLRREIDRIDEELLTLLALRFRLVAKVGCYKGSAGLTPLDEARWGEVLRTRMEIARKLGLDPELVREIYNLIHRFALRVESALVNPLEVAGGFPVEEISPSPVICGIQGGAGSFNEEAIHRYLDDERIDRYRIIYLYTTSGVLRELDRGSIDLGLFAICNSTGGMVRESVEAAASHRFEIACDLTIPIRHFLMRRADAETGEITTLVAHPQVFRQCQETLRRKYPGLSLRNGEGDLIDTAKAAESLSRGDLPSTTAILGPQGLAGLYGLEIIDKDLQDDPGNQTTFLLVRRWSGPG